MIVFKVKKRGFFHTTATHRRTGHWDLIRGGAGLPHRSPSSQRLRAQATPPTRRPRWSLGAADGGFTQGLSVRRGRATDRTPASLSGEDPFPERVVTPGGESLAPPRVKGQLRAPGPLGGELVGSQSGPVWGAGGLPSPEGLSAAPLQQRRGGPELRRCSGGLGWGRGVGTGCIHQWGEKKRQ